MTPNSEATDTTEGNGESSDTADEPFDTIDPEVRPTRPDGLSSSYAAWLAALPFDQLNLIAEFASELVAAREEYGEENEPLDGIEDPENPTQTEVEMWLINVYGKESMGVPPKASLNTKVIGAHPYFYWQWRDDDGVTSKYITAVSDTPFPEDQFLSEQQKAKVQEARQDSKDDS